MKPDKFDRWLLILMAALLIAMAVTLLYGRGRSRHGYGLLQWSPQRHVPTLAHNRVALRRPGVDPAIQVVNLSIPPPRQEVEHLGTA